MASASPRGKSGGLGCRAWRVVAGCVCLLPHLGCLSPFAAPAADNGDLNGTGTAPHKKVELPARVAAQANLTVARDLEKGGHYPEAIAHYEQARQDDPNLKQVSQRLAILYDRVGEHQLALAEYQKQLKDHPRDAEILNNFGYHYYGRGLWSDAETQFRQALEIDPHHQRAWINLGLTLAQQERYADCLEAFGHVISAGQAKSNLAFVLTTQGKREDAKQAYREALALEPDLRIAQLALRKLEEPAKPPIAAAKPAPAPAKEPVFHPASPPPAAAPATPSITPDPPPVIVTPPSMRTAPADSPKGPEPPAMSGGQTPAPPAPLTAFADTKPASPAAK